MKLFLEISGALAWIILGAASIAAWIIDKTDKKSEKQDKILREKYKR